MRAAPPWARPATAWRLNGRTLRVQCPPVFDLVPLLYVSPLYLLLSTLSAGADQLWLLQQVMPKMRPGRRWPYAPVDDAMITTVADRLVFSWCGYERWLVLRLWDEALPNWVMLDGPLAGRGVDIAELPPTRATRLIWSQLREWHANDKDKGEGWRRQLETPPRPAPVRRGAARAPAAAGDNAASFLSAFQAMGGGTAPAPIPARIDTGSAPRPDTL